MSLKIKLKHSAVNGKAPLPSDLDNGELALNTNAASPAAYIKDSAGNIVKLAGAGAIGGTDATTTAKGIVQLADATAITAGTAGLVVDAAQLKAADDWTRTGTVLSPTKAGDVVNISAGTAALPGLTPVGDPNTGIFFPAADTIAFAEGGSERVRLDASGRLLVGTSTAPSVGDGQNAKLVVQGYTGGTTGGGVVSIQRDQAATAISAGATLGFIGFNDSAGNTFASVKAEADGNAGAGDYPGRIVFSTTKDAESTPTERMRIKASGVINIAATTVYADNTAAKAGGLVAGDIYRKADGTLMITF